MNSGDSYSHAAYKSWLSSKRDTSCQYTGLFKITDKISRFQIPSNLSIKKVTKVSTSLTKQMKILGSDNVMVGFLVEPDERNYLAGSFFSKSGRMQAFWHRILGERFDLALAADLHCGNINPRNRFLMSIDYYGKNHGSSISYSTFGNIFGLKHCLNLKENLSAGAEVYYTADDKCGSLSIGFQKRFQAAQKHPLYLNGTLNPALGHSRVELALDLENSDTMMKVSFEFNIFNRLSELELSCLKTSSDSKEILQTRFSTTKGLGLFIGISPTDNWTIKMGLQSGLILPLFKTNGCASTGTNIGLELIYAD